MTKAFRDAAITALIAVLLALPIAGAKTVDQINGLGVEWHVNDVIIAGAFIFFARFAFLSLRQGRLRQGGLTAFLLLMAGFSFPLPSHFLKIAAVGGGGLLSFYATYLLSLEAFWPRLPLSDSKETIPSQGDRFNLIKLARLFGRLAFDKRFLFFLVAASVLFPVTPLASRYSLDVAIMVLTYVMLAWGLNISVGFAGLLDLGYVAFYAIGAYGYALLAPFLGIGFWLGLPLAGVIAAAIGFLLGFPVLRLRGDYFAIVTLGFGEIVRLIAANWSDLTNGPNGISGISRPSLFGLHFDPLHRVIFLYYIILLLAVLVGFATTRLRTLPLGRAWEAFREDEIACASLGINRTRIKLAAYSLSAGVAGLAGAFFAARQGFISPESFTFQESATILAIVILGGVGSPVGILFAAIFVIGIPELFRDLEQYRMLAFGAGMVLVMVTRPGGMTAKRQPTVLLHPYVAAVK